MGEPGLWADADKATVMTTRHAAARTVLEESYARWEEAQSAVAAAEQRASA